MKPSLRSAARRAVAALLPALLATTACAQPVSTLRDTLLGTPVVSAARRPAGLSSAVPAMELDTAALRRRGVTDVAGALRRLPGVNLRDYGGAGGLKTVSVRGLGASHTVVSYDGLPVGDARGGQIDIGRFNLDRLAAVSLSVADAPRLLVPVRTLAAATVGLASALPVASGGLHGTAALRFGSFGMAAPSFSLSVPAGRRTVAGLGGDFRYARNDYPFTLRNGMHTTRERRKGSRMQAWTGEADLSHATARGGTWTVKAHYDESHRRLPGQVVYYTDENDERLRERNAFAQTMWRQSCGPLTLMAGGKFAWQESRYADIDGQYPGGALRQDYRQREGYATAGLSYGLRRLRLAYAVDYTRSSLSADRAAGGPAARDALLQALSLRWRPARVELTARLLAHVYRDHRDGGAAARGVERLTPSLSASWLAVGRGGRSGCRTEWRWRAFVQELFRMPTFTERYYYHLGTQDLRPELARQAGVGTTLAVVRPDRPFESLSLAADAYLNRVSDRIQAVPRSIYVWQMTNVGRVSARGLDVALDARFRPARNHALSLAGNYSLQHVCDRTTPGGSSYGRQLAYTPRHSGAASLAWENPWAALVVHVTAASVRWTTNTHVPADTRLPGYAELGVGAYRTFRLGGVSLEARADLLNAFDRQYEVIRRYPMPGRSYRVALTARW